MSNFTYKMKFEEVKRKRADGEELTPGDIDFLVETVRRLGNLNDLYVKTISKTKANNAKVNKENSALLHSTESYCRELLELGFDRHCNSCRYNNTEHCKKDKKTQIYCIKQHFIREYNIQKVLDKAKAKE